MIVHRHHVLGLAVLLMLACREPPPAPAPPPPASEPTAVTLSAKAAQNAGIEVTALAPQAFSPRLALAATVVGDPRFIAQVGARVPGRVVAIRVALGDEVRKGQPLLDIESIDIHEATLKYLTATARLGAAEDALARQRLLVDEGVGPEAELRRAQADFAAVKAAVDEAEEHLRFLGLSPKSVRDLVDHEASAAHAGTVRAPISGRVTQLDVSVGQVLTGSEAVLTVADTKRIWASLRAYERDLRFIDKGHKVEVQVASQPGRTYEGRIDFVSDLVDPLTRTTEVRVPLDNAEGRLRPGTSATAWVALPTDPEALWVPEAAVQVVMGRASVFLRTKSGTYEPRAVEASPPQGGFRRLLSGVKPGDLVVTAGAFALRGELERALIMDEG